MTFRSETTCRVCEALRSATEIARCETIAVRPGRVKKYLAQLHIQMGIGTIFPSACDDTR